MRKGECQSASQSRSQRRTARSISSRSGARFTRISSMTLPLALRPVAGLRDQPIAIVPMERSELFCLSTSDSPKLLHLLVQPAKAARASGGMTSGTRSCLREVEGSLQPVAQPGANAVLYHSYGSRYRQKPLISNVFCYISSLEKRWRRRRDSNPGYGNCRYAVYRSARFSRSATCSGRRHSSGRLYSACSFCNQRHLF